MSIPVQNELPIQFTIKQIGKTMLSTWNVSVDHDIAGFILWGHEYGARYIVHDAGIKVAPGIMTSFVISSMTGTVSHNFQLYWHGTASSGNPLSVHARTHGLVHHSLDALPADFYTRLPFDLPIFRVEAPDGLFVMTIADWVAYLCSGRDSDKLIDLGR